MKDTKLNSDLQNVYDILSHKRNLKFLPRVSVVTMIDRAMNNLLQPLHNRVPNVITF